MYEHLLIMVASLKLFKEIYVSDCSCNANGSKNIACGSDGKCTCKENFSGDKCSICADGLYGLPNCTTGRYITFRKAEFGHDYF